MRRKALYMSFYPEELKEIEELAQRKGINRQDMIRMLVKVGLSTNKFLEQLFNFEEEAVERHEKLLKIIKGYMIKGS